MQAATDKNKGVEKCWELKEEELDRAIWRTRFGRGYGLVGKQT